MTLLRPPKRRPPLRLWTPEEDATVRQLYPDMTTAELAKRLDRTTRAVYERAEKLRVLKSQEFLASPAACRLRGDVGAAYRFKPGQKSWNKGKTYKAGGRSAETRFQPGIRPHTWVPVGTVVETEDGYLKQKIRDDAPKGMTRKNWKFVHILVWEAANGPLPEGHAVVFLDGNKKNCDLANLTCLSRGEIMRRNTIHRYPEELVSVMRLRGVLTRKINQRKQHEEQT